MFLRGFRYTHQLGKNIFLVVRSHQEATKKYSHQKTPEFRGFLMPESLDSERAKMWMEVSVKRCWPFMFRSSPSALSIRWSLCCSPVLLEIPCCIHCFWRHRHFILCCALAVTALCTISWTGLKTVRPRFRAVVPYPVFLCRRVIHSPERLRAVLPICFL